MADFIFKLGERRWRFGRNDGSTITSGMRLRRGRVLHHRNANESAWRMHEGCLEFLDINGETTTRFDHVCEREDGRIVLRGRYLRQRELEIWHVLEEEPVADLVRESPGRPRVAIMVRTHVVNSKLYHLLDCLADSPLFDLYVLVDETRGPLPIEGYRTCSHSIADCAALGLYVDHPNLLWMCGDYPLYCALHKNPDYDYFVQIEYDVHLVRESPLFLEGLLNRLPGRGGAPYDFLCAIWGPASKEWVWTANAQKVYPRVYGGLFSFITVSRSALEYLFQERLAEAGRNPGREDVIHCEAFVGTALMAGGSFRCGSIVEDLLPDTVRRETFRTRGAGNPKGQNFLLGTRIDDDPRVEMCHPVVDAEEYLGRMVAYARHHTDAIAEFITEVEVLPDVAIKPELKQRCMQELRKLLVA